MKKNEWLVRRNPKPPILQIDQATIQQTPKQQWQALFADDPVDLTHLPKPIVIKTRQILVALNQGIAPSHFRGKRLSFDRTLLSIPVTYRYRLLCRWYANQIIPLQVFPHEAYNAIVRNKKRVKDL